MIESEVIQEIASHYTGPDTYYSFILPPILHRRIYVLTKLASRFPCHKHRKLRKCEERRITKHHQKAQRSIISSYERLYKRDKYAQFLHPNGYSYVRNNPLPIIEEI